MPTVKDRINDFIARHGDFVLLDGIILHEDGAAREPNAYGYLKDPPADVYECNKLKVRFCEKKLSLAAEEFSALKRNVLLQTKANMQGNRCSAPSDAQKEAVALLKTLKKKVGYFKHKLNEAKTNMEQSRPKWMTEREIDTENNRIENEKLRDELSEIEI